LRVNYTLGLCCLQGTVGSEAAKSSPLPSRGSDSQSNRKHHFKST
jgi:hypothetical protein